MDLSSHKGLDLAPNKGHGEGQIFPVVSRAQHNVPDHDQPKGEEKCNENDPPVATPAQAYPTDPGSRGQGVELPCDEGIGKRAPPIGNPMEDETGPLSVLKGINHSKGEEQCETTADIIELCEWSFGADFKKYSQLNFMSRHLQDQFPHPLLRY